MKEPRLPQLVAIDSQIDRLVDGELPDADRRALLQRLETESGGWRRCALAFLEAQSWREALVPVAAAATALPPPPVTMKRRMPHRWRSAAQFTSLAASLVLTFGLGWALHGKALTTSDKELVAKVHEPIPALPIEQQQPVMNLQTKLEALPSPSAEKLAALAPVVKQWEHQGYQAETQTRLASVKLKDGRRVEIPVQEVRLRYVGNRTY